MISEQQKKYYDGMEHFIAAIKSCGEDNQEAFELFLDLIRKHMMWHYDYKYFNVKSSEVNFYERETVFFDIFEKEERISKEKRLNQLCIFTNIWDPKKFRELHGNIYFDENEFSQNFIYLKNLKIGRVVMDGNRRTFKAINTNEKVDVWVQEIQDERILKVGKTDGVNLYYDNNTQKLPDERFAMLFTLTKIKLGFETIEEFEHENYEFWIGK